MTCSPTWTGRSDDAAPGQTVAMTEPDARFTLANERTMLAYQRSAIGLMAAAIAVAHFFGDGFLVLLLALALLATGALAAVGGYLRFRQVDAAMREGRPIGSGYA